ncbi:MAG: GNAT family N-acetyltransferase [Actinomycetota bacterium]
MIEIREATPEDYAAAGGAAVAGYAAYYGADLGSYEKNLRDVAGRVKSAAVLVAVEDGVVVGTVTYVRDATSPSASHQREDEASIRMLAVKPSHARRGIGRSLSVACIERARADGKRAISLHADEVMQASQRLYESLGFRRDPSRDYRPDEITFLFCYVLEL